MKRRTLLRAALIVLSVATAACGSSSDSSEDPGGLAISEEGGPRAPDAASTRSAAGIAAAGGRLPGGPACPDPGSAEAGDTVKIAWADPDLNQLADAGLETLVLDQPALTVGAYIDEVNFQGGQGIGGNCFELLHYSWDLSNPDESFLQICTDLAQQRPLLLLSIALNNTTLRCATLAERIPTFVVSATVSNSSVAAADGSLFLADGSLEYLLSSSLDVAASEELLTADDLIGLLVTDNANTESEMETAQRASERLGLDIVGLAAVPTEFGTIGASRAERQVRLLESDLSDSEHEAALRRFSQLSAEHARVLQQMERFFLDTVGEMQSAGVTAVVASASSADVRRLMRAADRLDWFPQWVITDSQPAVLTLTNAPREQGLNLVQISSKRAAGDEIPELDRGCINLRNTSAEAPHFSHRVHTDAWNLTTAICDYLDVTFGAVTRVSGPLTREALSDALNATDYETAHGSRIRFASDDRNGADRFRVLRADPDCVLDYWGCMRAISDWSMPDAGA